MRRLVVALLAASAVAAAGCLDVQESLTLDRNLSGQARFVMNVDMEPMVAFVAQMQRQMAGKTGAPTAEELAAARAQMLKSANPADDFEKDKREMEQRLPPGVKLLDATMKTNGLKAAASVLFAFQNADALNKITFERPADQQGDAGPQNPVSDPFEGLKVVDEGPTVLITSEVVDPISKAKSQASQLPMNAAMQQQFAAMFKGLHVAVRITAPFAVVEQNATRKEGDTLVWEFDSARLQAMTAGQLEHGIRVRYRK